MSETIKLEEHLTRREGEYRVAFWGSWLISIASMLVFVVSVVMLLFPKDTSPLLEDLSADVIRYERELRKENSAYLAGSSRVEILSKAVLASQEEVDAATFLAGISRSQLNSLELGSAEIPVFSEGLTLQLKTIVAFARNAAVRNSKRAAEADMVGLPEEGFRHTYTSLLSAEEDPAAQFEPVQRFVERFETTLAPAQEDAVRWIAEQYERMPHLQVIIVNEATRNIIEPFVSRAVQLNYRDNRKIVVAVPDAPQSIEQALAEAMTAYKRGEQVSQASAQVSEQAQQDFESDALWNRLCSSPYMLGEKQIADTVRLTLSRSLNYEDLSDGALGDEAHKKIEESLLSSIASRPPALTPDPPAQLSPDGDSEKPKDSEESTPERIDAAELSQQEFDDYVKELSDKDFDEQWSSGVIKDRFVKSLREWLATVKYDSDDQNERDVQFDATAPDVVALVSVQVGLLKVDRAARSFRAEFGSFVINTYLQALSEADRTAVLSAKSRYPDLRRPDSFRGPGEDLNENRGLDVHVEFIRGIERTVSIDTDNYLDMSTQTSASRLLRDWSEERNSDTLMSLRAIELEQVILEFARLVRKSRQQFGADRQDQLASARQILTTAESELKKARDNSKRLREELLVATRSVDESNKRMTELKDDQGPLSVAQQARDDAREAHAENRSVLAAGPMVAAIASALCQLIAGTVLVLTQRARVAMSESVRRLIDEQKEKYRIGLLTQISNRGLREQVIATVIAGQQVEGDFSSAEVDERQQ